MSIKDNVTVYTVWGWNMATFGIITVVIFKSFNKGHNSIEIFPRLQITKSFNAIIENFNKALFVAF